MNNGLLSLFQNWIAGAIVIIELLLVSIGILIACTNQYIYGYMMSAIGILLIAYGWRQYGPEPFEGGVLTSFGQIITTETDSSKKRTGTITVKGMIVLFPPFIDALRISMENTVWNFPKEVLSVEKQTNANGERIQIPLKGIISLTVRPDEKDMLDYIRAGQMKEIEGQVNGIVFRETQKLITTLKDPISKAKGMSAIAIAQYGQYISERLEHLVKGTHNVPGVKDKEGVFEQKSFGIECLKVQIDFPLPQNVRDAMVDSLSINYETAARQTEYDGDIAAAKKLMSKEQGLGLIDGQKAFDAAIELRLVRDKKINRLQIEGKGASVGGAVIVNNPNIGMGNEGGKKGKDN